MKKWARKQTYLCLLFFILCSCSGSGSLVSDGDQDVENSDSFDQDALDREVSDEETGIIDGDEETAEMPESEVDGEEELPTAFNPDAAARAFQLYYKERVERVVVAYNRFGIFGDLGFGTTIGKVGVARSGTQFEVVPGPNDNNMIGLSVWTTWNAYKVFQTRKLALSMIRMFEGLAFMEAVSGHPGLTARCAYPGWTLGKRPIDC